MGGLSGVLGGGKSSGGSSTASNTVVVPKWLDSQNKALVNRAVEASNTAYTPYTGQRVADFTADQNAAFAMNRANSGKYNNLMNTASSGVMDLMGRVNGPNATQLQSLMNPYTQNVTNIAQRGAIEDAARAKNQLGRDAQLANSFGGSRFAIREALGEKNLAQQLQDLEYKGQFDAFNNAQNQWNTGTNTLASGINAALGTANQGQTMDTNDFLNLLKSGTVQQSQTQQGLDVNYSDWQEKQAYPYEQINFLANILNPQTATYAGGETTQMQNQGSGSKLGQLAGTALSIASFFKDGGSVEGYARGGDINAESPESAAKKYTPVAGRVNFAPIQNTTTKEDPLKQAQALAGMFGQDKGGSPGGLMNWFSNTFGDGGQYTDLGGGDYVTWDTDRKGNKFGDAFSNAGTTFATTGNPWAAAGSALMSMFGFAEGGEIPGYKNGSLVEDQKNLATLDAIRSTMMGPGVGDISGDRSLAYNAAAALNGTFNPMHILSNAATVGKAGAEALVDKAGPIADTLFNKPTNQVLTGPDKGAEQDALANVQSKIAAKRADAGLGNIDDPTPPLQLPPPGEMAKWGEIQVPTLDEAALTDDSWAGNVAKQTGLQPPKAPTGVPQMVEASSPQQQVAQAAPENSSQSFLEMMRAAEVPQPTAKQQQADGPNLPLLAAGIAMMTGKGDIFEQAGEGLQGWLTQKTVMEEQERKDAAAQAASKQQQLENLLTFLRVKAYQDQVAMMGQKDTSLTPYQQARLDQINRGLDIQQKRVDNMSGDGLIPGFGADDNGPGGITWDDILGEE